jgi:hypothetical protein
MAETARALEMRRVMEEYEGSGQSRGAFCAKRGIALSTFDYWRRELSKQPRMVAVKIARAETRFTLVLSNGRRIESSEENLEQMIRIAERA